VVTSKATSVAQYLAELPEERRAVVAKVRAAISKAMPKGYVESMAFGMIGWGIPLSRYPDTYNGQPLSYVALAAQKDRYSLYLVGCYMDPSQTAALKAAFAKIGSKPDMGKSCVRFRRIEDIPLEAIAKLVSGMGVEDYIARYEKSRPKKK
jgi:hypothetical protein